VLRVAAHAGLMTDQYPPYADGKFSLDSGCRADQDIWRADEAGR
jgi:hypothetical protein